MKKSYLLFPFLLVAFVINAQTTTTIYFSSGKSELSKTAKHALDSLKDYFKTKSNASFIINGHADNVGTDESNMVLSNQRAKSVTDYFESNSIPSNTITSKGFGQDKPIADNDTEAGRAKNRRVDIIVTIPAPKMEEQPPLAPAKVNDMPAKVITHTTAALTDTSSSKNLQVGQVLRLANLNFVGGTAHLLPESKPALETLLKVMQDNPTLEIEIGGHVCCANDMPLSEDRALAVEKYLTGKGISKFRMVSKGYSRSKPIAQDDRTNEEGARMNRRVEITILKK